MTKELTVIVGGTGKTGRRVAQRLKALGLPVRAVSPRSEVRFDWGDPSTWEAALDGAGRLYLTYYPDLAVSGAAVHVRALCAFAVERGIETIVLLAGRGEPQVRPAEDAVRESGVKRWTILECAFFMQNFTEGVLVPREDTIAFAGGEVREPFIDCDDIADCVVEALLNDTHSGQIYELTGPELLTYAEATEILGAAQGRTLQYLPLTFEQLADALSQDFAAPVVDFFIALFRWLLDGHNAFTTDGVERMLGRPASRFETFANRAHTMADAAE